MYEINIRNKRIWNGEGEYVGRPSALGNPIQLDSELSREACVDKYGIWLVQSIHKERPSAMKSLNYLFEKLVDDRKLNLVCWCSPKLCHSIFIKQVLLNKFYYGHWLIDDDIGVCGL